MKVQPFLDIKIMQYNFQLVFIMIFYYQKTRFMFKKTF